MSLDDPESRNYLQELYAMTAGDPEAQVSMHDIGDAIGLDRTEAGRMAEELMFTGLVELKSLSGGIGITEEGIAELGLTPSAAAPGPGSLSLGSGAILGQDSDREVRELLEEIKQAVAAWNGSYAALEEAVLDIRTLEVHLLSPRPKTGVIRELFRALGEHFAQQDAGQMADRLLRIASD